MHWFLKHNCDFDGLGEEREQTETPTDARVNRLEGGWWWVDDERGRGAGLRVWMRRKKEEMIESIAYEFHRGW